MFTKKKVLMTRTVGIGKRFTPPHSGKLTNCVIYFNVPLWKKKTLMDCIKIRKKYI